MMMGIVTSVDGRWARCVDGRLFLVAKAGETARVVVKIDPWVEMNLAWSVIGREGVLRAVEKEARTIAARLAEHPSWPLKSNPLAGN